jgi:hypothetical protein
MSTFSFENKTKNPDDSEIIRKKIQDDVLRRMLATPPKPVKKPPAPAK